MIAIRGASRAAIAWLAGHALAVAFLLVGDVRAEQTGPYTWAGIERIVAIGDVHGDYDNYIAALREAGLVDRRERWAGGETHLVQLGDVPDRGPDTDRIIEHLRKLEKQARRAGGQVHALIGNHEAMNIIGDLRYVHPGEYAAFETRSSERLLEDYYERVVAFRRQQEPGYEPTEADREAWFEAHPRGFIEHRQHWHPQGEIGSWVLEHATMIRINDTLFVHGGLGEGLHGLSLEEINDRVREELSDVRAAPQPLFIESPDGPLWHRGLSHRPGETTPADQEEVTRLLESFGAQRIVLGHTPGYGTVMPRYDGRVLLADTGISSAYGGHVAAVLIEGGEAFTLQAGERIAIPTSDEGLLPYLQKIAQTVPEPAGNLAFIIDRISSEGPESIYYDATDGAATDEEDDPEDK